MNLPYKCDYHMTVGELRNKLKGMPIDALVYVVTDTSDDNYEEAVEVGIQAGYYDGLRELV